MPCNCAKNNRRQYQVVLGGKVVFGPVAEKATADAAARRYPGSTVVEKPATTAPAKTPARAANSPT